MKYEWKKQEKNLYLPKEKPELLTVPLQKFVMIKGRGNPNKEDFAERIGVLYSMAYGIKMMPRHGYEPEGYFEYTVYPLEGIWDLTEAGKKADKLEKEEFLYTIMIRQPDFVNSEVFKRAFAAVKKKKPHSLLDEISFDTMEDGLSVQMLHIGSFDDEQKSFEQMNQFLIENNLTRATLTHREIYLSDFRKTETAKLRTVLRYKVIY